jgi:hypothetical protein
MAVMTPIEFVGESNAGQLNMFFGNTAVAPSSTAERLASTGAGTCLGGAVNRSAFWAPAVFDATTGEVQTPRSTVIHYASGYNLDPSLTQPVPAGLRMVSGDPRATRPQNGAPHYAVRWGCELAYMSADDGLIPACPVGDAVQLHVTFPQCWNGRDLDSPDHRSHVVFAEYRRPPQRSSCPTTHPVQLPTLTQTYTFPVYADTRPVRWRLSSDTYATTVRGGLSAHAFWIEGWAREVMTTFVRECINGRRDCEPGALGEGRRLEYYVR